MGSQIEDLLHQKMDRKQFLKNIGAGLTAVIGLGVIVRAFQSPQSDLGHQPSQQANGSYSSSVYGGSYHSVGSAPAYPKVQG